MVLLQKLHVENKKTRIGAIIVLLLVISIFVFKKYSYLFKNESPNGQQDTSTNYNYKDIFNWDSSMRKVMLQDRPLFQIAKDGSSLIMYSSATGSLQDIEEVAPRWNAYTSTNTVSWLPVVGDFSLQFSLIIGKGAGVISKSTKKLAEDFGNIVPSGGSLPFSPIIVLEINNPSLDVAFDSGGYDWITIFISEDRYFFISYQSPTFKKRSIRPTPSEIKKLPDSGEIAIEFRNVNTSDSETVSVLDSKTGEVIIETALPFDFWREKRKLCYGFQLRPAIEFFSLVNMKMTPLK